MKYFGAHLGLAIAAMLVGYFVCKRFPKLFDNIPILDGVVPGQGG